VTTPVPDFSRLRVAVAGDLVADHYLLGEPARLSREAPVMVLRYRGEELGAGGAANTARNLRALGAEVRVLGCVGRDRNGRELLTLLAREGIEVEGVEALAGWTTPTKTRVLGAEPGRKPQQVLRLDREPGGPPPSAARARVAGELRALAGAIDALLFSDYGYGLVGSELADAGRALRTDGAVVVLDPRRSIETFRGVTALTPNLGELAAAARVSVDELGPAAALACAARELLERCEVEHVLVTRGNRGMSLFSRGAEGPLSVPAAGPEAVDVSGAGDTAAAAFTLALAAGRDATQAMRLANAAAGVVVMEPGTAVCPLDRLRSAFATAPLARAGEPVPA
jgi:rfaE bifunctional protein kinase chain/domain